MPVFAQLACNLEAVFTGQPQVKQDQSRRIERHQGHQRVTVVDRRDAIAVTTQVVRQQLRDVDFVVQDGDVEGLVQWGQSGQRPDICALSVSACRSGPDGEHAPGRPAWRCFAGIVVVDANQASTKPIAAPSNERGRDGSTRQPQGAARAPHALGKAPMCRLKLRWKRAAKMQVSGCPSRSSQNYGRMRSCLSLPCGVAIPCRPKSEAAGLRLACRRN